MIRAPLLDHMNKPSWTSTIVIIWLVVIIAALSIWWFCPEDIACRVECSSSFLRDSFFAIVVAYVVRRHTQAKHETNDTPETKDALEDE